MGNIKQFQVNPELPKNLKHLQDLAFNLMWAWDHDMISIFRRLDRNLWVKTNHNPVLMLGSIDQARLNQLSDDSSFVAHVERMKKKMDDYMSEETWYQKKFKDKSKNSIAYFSLEFGITESVQIYSGGLGILAGDHLKSASDLGIPLVGVGLLYQQGYFRQYLNIDGWQQELYPKNDFYNLPVKMVKDKKGDPIKIKLFFPGRDVLAQVWEVQVGRVQLILLDTNIDENQERDRQISYQLYGGNKEMRMQQEILLGVGGLRALEKMGITPDVCHMNEGHAAFLALQKLVDSVQTKGLSPRDAIALVKAGTIFTTHTPVPAGIDTFDPKMMMTYFSDFAEILGMTHKDFLAFGRLDPEDDKEEFNMAFLALHLSSHCNGVSKLHGEVSRKMWSKAWPEFPDEEVPITSITNGIHVRSWLSPDMEGLFERYLGSEWIENPSDQSIWERIENIPPEELWRTHERRRERLISFARNKLKYQLEQRGASPFQIMTAKEALDPNALTIGFARRFATYKRATLFLEDQERLKKILLNKELPVQFIFAGKAHPRDEEGKRFIKEVVHFSRDPQIRRRIVFLEDYDANIARYMVSGVDVWLNNPRRPMEASGTSGMKAMVNGVLNCSIIDGWWAEAYELSQDVGWAIGHGEDYDDETYQDQVESNALYNLLENEIIPLYYERAEDNIPWGWINKMKETMRVLGPVFNTNRMVREYTERFYVKVAERNRLFSENKYSKAIDYMEVWHRVKDHWDELKIVDVKADSKNGISINSKLGVDVDVELGGLDENVVDVQIFHGKLTPDKEILNGVAESMSFSGKEGTTSHFSGAVSASASGLHGFRIRIMPKYEGMVHPYEWHLIKWD